MTTPHQPSRFALARQRARRVLTEAFDPTEASGNRLVAMTAGALASTAVVGVMASGGRADYTGLAIAAAVAGTAVAVLRARESGTGQTPAGADVLTSMGRAALTAAVVIQAGNGLGRVIVGEPTMSTFRTNDQIAITVVRDAERTPGRATGVMVEMPNGREGTREQIMVIADSAGGIGLRLPTGEAVLIERTPDGQIRTHTKPVGSEPVTSVPAPAPTAIASAKPLR